MARHWSDRRAGERPLCVVLRPCGSRLCRPHSSLGGDWLINGDQYAPMAIDCNRLHSRGGTMYYVDQFGHVNATLVDSPGINSKAPWPKYQHDPANTGN